MGKERSVLSTLFRFCFKASGHLSCTPLVYLFVYLHQGTMAQSRKQSTERNALDDTKERIELIQGYRTPYKEDQSLRMCLQHALNALFQEPGKFTKSDLNAICKLLKSREEKDYGKKAAKQLPSHGCKYTGNYDVNVLAEALRQEGAYHEWLSQEQFKKNGVNLLDDDFLCAPPESDNTEDVSGYKFLGFILNVQSSGILGSSGHWKTIKKINWSEDAPKFQITNPKRSANKKGARNRRAVAKSTVLHKDLASKLIAEEWYDLDSKLNDSKKMSEEDVMDLLSKVIKEDGHIIVCRQKVDEKPLPRMPEMDDIEQKMEEMKWDVSPETQTDTIASKVGSTHSSKTNAVKKNTDTTVDSKKKIGKNVTNQKKNNNNPKLTQ